MKKIIITSLIGMIGFSLSACAEKKDYEYYRSHIEEAKQNNKECRYKGIENTDEECKSSMKAFSDYRAEQRENATKTPTW